MTPDDIIRMAEQAGFGADWQDKVNRWGWCFERRCRKCGAVQHNVWEDFISWRDLGPKWRDGPHP